MPVGSEIGEFRSQAHHVPGVCPPASPFTSPQALVSLICPKGMSENTFGGVSDQEGRHSAPGHRGQMKLAWLGHCGGFCQVRGDGWEVGLGAGQS